MEDPQPEIPFSSFTLLTPRLILMPTPIAVSAPSYLSLYVRLHANASFCEMGFGSAFPAVAWTKEQARQTIATRDIARCWSKRGMGDFAVGLRKNEQLDVETGRSFEESGANIRIIEDAEVSQIFSPDYETLHAIEWLGYAGIRDATTTSMPPRTADDPPMPPWQEMVELRYGVAPEHWGKGIAREAAEAVMCWGVSKRRVKRFIAETEKENTRSGRVLEKMGFRKSGTEYWKEPGEVEWERVVG
jgi:RimJ/RimL family protein N-acetyltransferase